MKIINNQEIQSYLKRLEKNLEANYQNDFLDGYISPKDEKAAKKDLYEAGQIECLDEKLSLYISTDKFLENPYIQNVVNKVLENKDFVYDEITFEKNVLFNSESIIDDPDKELKDYMKLRMLDKDLNTFILKENKVEWMMAVPSESLTNDPYALKAKGKVVSFGLGIGYFIYQAMLNDKVSEITVIEKSKEVINLFKKIYKYFPNRIKLNIIQGDAYDYFNEKFLKDFDYIYVDIYQNDKDGLIVLSKLLSNYLPEYSKCDFWIEASITNVIRTLIYLIYKEMATGKKAQVNNDYYIYLNKVRKYFETINTTVDDVNTLKDYMYNPSIIRQILHTKIN